MRLSEGSLSMGRLFIAIPAPLKMAGGPVIEGGPTVGMAGGRAGGAKAWSVCGQAGRDLPMDHWGHIFERIICPCDMSGLNLHATT